ncbi:anti-sigma factor [Spongiimicrobium salis]|uniref:anti-sigma factor n=1 Tax=Spongiimicrobium salis TaxID=1667022 RepID=UPI00374D2EEC
MDSKAYIASGILELYVAGKLSADENLEVAKYAETYPEIKKEIEAIEASILQLSKIAAPKKAMDFGNIRERITEEQQPKVVPMPKSKLPWYAYAGWAASFVLLVGLLYVFSENTGLKSKIEVVESERFNLEEEIEKTRNSLTTSETLLNTLRDKDIRVVALGGQQVSPDAYAKVYWNNREQKVFIDAQGLPEPPEGKEYQVWSLTLDPLTPTSVGLLSNFKEEANGIFEMDNQNASEAFGITLEPAGGSEAPNLEQLYVLGTVSP